MDLTFLSGGTGTPKLLDGLRHGARNTLSDLTVVVNTADDCEISGNLVCPDVDTVLYTLAGRIDRNRWFGIADDTHVTNQTLRSHSPDVPSDGADLPPDQQTRGRDLSRWRRLSGIGEFMQIGDRDRATHILRTALLDRGHSLLEATAVLAEKLGVAETVLPMSNDPVATWIHTREHGAVHFQEYWIRHHGSVAVESVEFRGAGEATVPSAVEDALGGRTVVGPANPITSINPMLSLEGVRDRLRQATVIVISPFVGTRVVSGPAAQFMEAEGLRPSTQGVASFYGELLDGMIVDESDTTELEVPVMRTNTIMNEREDRVRLAHDTLKFMARF